MNGRGNPFKTGDTVVFDPDARTTGWTYSSFDRLRIHPGDVGIVTEIVDDIIFIDDHRGGFAWECFKTQVENSERSQTGMDKLKEEFPISSEISVKGNSSLIAGKTKAAPRTGWAEASREIAALGDDKLVLGEFANEEDANLMW